MTGPTAVVVLAGGEGRRMGGGKPLRPYGSTTLLAHAVGLARGWSPIVAVAVRSADQAAGATDSPLIVDDPAIAGPAAGLAAAFAFAVRRGADRLLTLPCDAPCLPRDLLTRLEAGLGNDAGVAVAASLGRLHPTCALWRMACAERLPGYLIARSSLRGFAAECGLAAIEWPCDAEADPFANANTPAELAALQPDRLAHAA